MNDKLDFTAEIERLDQDIRSATAGIDRFLTMAGLLGAAAVTVGLSRREAEPLILVLVPYAMAIVMAFILQIYTDTERMYVLRQALEQHQWDATGDPMLQTVVMDAGYRGRLSVRITSLIWAALLVGLFATSIWTGVETLATGWMWLHAVGIALAGLAIVCAAFELMRASKATLAVVSPHLTPPDEA